MWGTFLKEVPPHPLKNLLTRGYQNKFAGLLTDGRRNAGGRLLLLPRAIRDHQPCSLRKLFCICVDHRDIQSQQ